MGQTFFNRPIESAIFFALIFGCIYSEVFKHFVLVFAFVVLGRHLSFLTVTNTNSMKGKTVLITGASAGLGEYLPGVPTSFISTSFLGYETALDMARRGAKVIIGNRSIEGLKEKIEATVPGSQVDVFKLDLSLKQSILDFCAKVRAGHDKIHVFINNAALVAK